MFSKGIHSRRGLRITGIIDLGHQRTAWLTPLSGWIAVALIARSSSSPIDRFLLGVGIILLCIRLSRFLGVNFLRFCALLAFVAHLALALCQLALLF